MGRKQIEEQTEALLIPIAEANGVNIYDVEYVKEAGEAYLRCYIDKEGGVTIDDCVAVNRALSKALDEVDFVGEPYTLEVGSPGLGRRLTRDRHLSQSIGKQVEGKLFLSVNQQKEFSGILTSFDRDCYLIQTDAGEIRLERKNVALLKLALDF